MYTVAITLLNGHSVNVPMPTDEEKNQFIETVLSKQIVSVRIRSGEQIFIITDKISYITVYKEGDKK